MSFKALANRAQAVQPVESVPGAWDIFLTRCKGIGFIAASFLVGPPVVMGPMAVPILGAIALASAGILPAAAAISVGAVATAATGVAAFRYAFLPLVGNCLDGASRAGWKVDEMKSQRYWHKRDALNNMKPAL